MGSEKHFESKRMVSERWKQPARPSEGECLGSLHPVGRHPAVNGNEAPTPPIEADPRTHEAERREPVTEGHRVCHPTDGKCPEQANPQIQKAPYPWSPRWGWGGGGRLLTGTGLPWGGDCSGTRQRWQRLSLAHVLSAAEPRTSNMSRRSVLVLCFATLQEVTGVGTVQAAACGCSSSSVLDSAVRANVRVTERRGKRVERAVKTKVSRCRLWRCDSSGATPGSVCVRAARPWPLERASAFPEPPSWRASKGSRPPGAAALCAPSPSPEETVGPRPRPLAAPSLSPGPGTAGRETVGRSQSVMRDGGPKMSPGLTAVT